MAESIIGKPLPHDDYIERAMLGAILSEHPQASNLLDILRPEDFYDEGNRRILSEMQKDREAGKQPSLLTLYDAFTLAGSLEAVGGIAYVASLGDGVHRGSDMLPGARSLRRMATFRQVLHLAERVKMLAFEPEARTNCSIVSFSNSLSWRGS
jgi:replicative DNA helicase